MKLLRVVLLVSAIATAPYPSYGWTDCLSLTPGKDGSRSLLEALPAKADFTAESEDRWTCKEGANTVLLSGSGFCSSNDIKTKYIAFQFSKDDATLLDARVGLAAHSESAYKAAHQKIAARLPVLPRESWPPELLNDLAELPFGTKEHIIVFKAPDHLVILRRSGTAHLNAITNKWDTWKWHNEIRIVRPLKFRSYLAEIWYCAQEEAAGRKN